MSLSTNQPVGYLSIWHLASITEKDDTESVSLNLQPAEELPLTQDDQEELNFPNECIFLRHVETAPREVYNSVMRLWKHPCAGWQAKLQIESKIYQLRKGQWKIYHWQRTVENQELRSRNAIGQSGKPISWPGETVERYLLKQAFFSAIFTSISPTSTPCFSLWWLRWQIQAFSLFSPFLQDQINQAAGPAYANGR